MLLVWLYTLDVSTAGILNNLIPISMAEISKRLRCPLSKEAMWTEVDGEVHYVIYIEYTDNIPHDVKTIHFIETAEEPYWRLYDWDAFANDGDKRDIRLYNSGSGGCETDIAAPHWANGYIGTYWLANGFKLKGEVINGMKIHLPIRLKGYYISSINPFKIGETTASCEYCARCDNYKTDVCWQHMYEDENDDYTLKYKDDNSLVE